VRRGRGVSGEEAVYPGGESWGEEVGVGVASREEEVGTGPRRDEMSDEFDPSVSIRWI
jgi:hypothetical protein